MRHGPRGAWAELWPLNTSRSHTFIRSHQMGKAMAERKKIAAIVTTYFQGSHADLIVSKFLEGFPTVDGLVQPSVDLVSMYMDQVHGSDVGMAAAGAHGVTVYPSIRGALTLVHPSKGSLADGRRLAGRRSCGGRCVTE